MEMIIGGAYQGKSSYAEKQFPDVKWKCGAELTEEELLEAEGVERQYREAVGRVCTELAGKSSRVTRVVCGIGMVLKNA